MIMGDRKKLLSAVLGPRKVEHEAAEEAPHALETIMQELIECIHSHDVKGASDAFKAAFELCEEMPHEEGPHLE